MGKRSYSLYLVHFPLLLAIKFLLQVKQFPRYLDGMGLGLTMFFVGVPACILFAAFFFRQVESHFLKLPPALRKRFARSSGLPEASSASALS
jgi:peptidoglycan/LPS O-acetylase OafA/YrhL